MAEFKRHVACKAKIKDLLDGEYVKQEGEWAPSFIKCTRGDIARANIIAAVVSKTEEGSQLILDDGSAKINVRSFDTDLSLVNVGDFVLVIGKPREFDSERYIVPEIVKKIDNPGWVELRKKELELLRRRNVCRVIEDGPAPESEDVEEVINETETIQEDKVKGKDNASKVYEYIKEKDNGAGIEIQEIVDAGLANAEEIVLGLLEKGEVFEVKPGKVKLLE